MTSEYKHPQDDEARLIFGDLMKAVCWDRTRIPRLVDMDASISGIDPDSLRNKYYDYRAGRRRPSLEMAWFIGEALHALGETWISGIITIFAAGYFAEFVVMIDIVAHDVSPSRLKSMIVTLPSAIRGDADEQQLNFTQMSNSSGTEFERGLYDANRQAWHDVKSDGIPSPNDCRSNWIFSKGMHEYIDAQAAAMLLEARPADRFRFESLILAHEAATSLELPFKRKATHVLTHLIAFAEELADD